MVFRLVDDISTYSSKGDGGTGGRPFGCMSISSYDICMCNLLGSRGISVFLFVCLFCFYLFIFHLFLLVGG